MKSLIFVISIFLIYTSMPRCDFTDKIISSVAKLMIADQIEMSWCRNQHDQHDQKESQQVASIQDSNDCNCDSPHYIPLFYVQEKKEHKKVVILDQQLHPSWFSKVFFLKPYLEFHPPPPKNPFLPIV